MAMVYFIFLENGLYYIEQTKDDEYKRYISSPIKVLAQTRDTTNNAWGRLLEWRSKVSQPFQNPKLSQRVFEYRQQRLASEANGPPPLLPPPSITISEWVRSIATPAWHACLWTANAASRRKTVERRTASRFRRAFKVDPALSVSGRALLARASQG